MLTKNKIVSNLEQLMPKVNILSTPEECYVYSQDGTNGVVSNVMPDVVVFPECIEEVQSILKFAIVILNVVLTIILIKKWDALLGATVGTLISLVLGDVFVMQFVFKKDIGIKLFSYYKNTFIKDILPCLLLSIIGGLAIRGLNFAGWLGFVVNCCVMVAIYSVTMLLYGMNDYEKKLIFKPFKKILKKIHIVKEV